MQSLLKSVSSRSPRGRRRRDRGHRDEAATTQQPSTVTTSTPNVETKPSDIFASTCASFIDSLREEERAKFIKFDNAQSMLQNFQQLALDNPAQKSRLLACCHKLEILTSTLSPFFEVVNNLVQSPECAGVAWGALRLISVLGVNYVSFLEKMGNMFEQMASALPIFEEFSIALRNGQTSPKGPGYTRITQLLAQIYSDLIQFCHRACKLFTPSGHFSKAKLHLSLAWTPFDLYFSDLLEKFSYHSKLFRLEMKATSNNQVLDFYSEWQRRVASREATAEKELIETNILVLQKRIRPPGWAANFEHARNHRVDDTGHWLLNDSSFCRHVNFTSHDQDGHQRNILFVTAKPGYGKTTLATLVIDHLKSATTFLPNNHTQHVAFYFFDKQNGNASHSYDAYRALLSQLVHLRRHDEKVIDIATIARPEHDTGQSFASDDEVYDILHLLLLHIGPCHLILDGVDECANRADLFRGLCRIASDHKNCRIILLSRPSVKLPLQISKQCEFLDLGMSRNLEDLTKYIEPLVQDLVESGELVLPELVTLENVVRKIVSKADGMFLWVTLFMEYLRLPSLTISGRWKDIEDPSRFEGLYNLYEGIFAALQKEYPRSTRVKVRRALQWVCGAFRPLHIEELRIAIEIEPNVALGHHDVIPNFAQELGPMSGALLEVTKDDTVRLIHLTLYEYLVSAAPNLSAFADNIGSTTTFTPQVVHYYASVSCLSYLRHTIPPGPYGNFTSGSSGPALPWPMDVYPLMEYATKFWISHFFSMYNAIKSNPKTGNDNQALETVGESCVAFISDKIKFTSWIEAFWRLGFKQELQKLLGGFLKEAFQRESSVELSSKESSFTKALSLMRVVWEEQTYLISSWRRVLEAHPEEIWKPSISAFSRVHQPSPLHELSDAATMHTLARPKTVEAKYTVILSQVSSCGQELAVITVKKLEKIIEGGDRIDVDLPNGSRAFSAFDSTEQFTRRGDNQSDNSSTITVSYQIWSLENVDQLIYEQSVDISRKSLVQATTPRNRDDFPKSSFLFPASITPTLREAVFIDTFLKIFTSNSPTGIEFHTHVQRLEFPWIFQDSLIHYREIPIRQNRQSSSNEVEECGMSWDHFPVEDSDLLSAPGPSPIYLNDSSDTHIRFPSFYELVLSPCGKFLLVLRQGVVTSSWSIDIFQDLAYDSRPDQPRFQWVAGQDLHVHVADPYHYLTEYKEWDEEYMVGRPDSDSKRGTGNPEIDTEPATNNGSDEDHYYNTPKDAEYKECSFYQRPVEVAFHPNLPQVAFATDKTYLWDFSTMNASGHRRLNELPLLICDKQISRMTFSPCGQRLHGFEKFEKYGAKYGVIVNLPQNSSTSNSTDPTDESISQISLFDNSSNSLTKCVIPDQQAPSTQTSNTSFIARDANGIPTISTLQQSDADNSLTLHTFNAHGQSREETLLRLPCDIANNGSITLLNPLKHKPGELRIVLEAPKRDYYTLDEEEAGDVRLPAMIQRTVQSIPVFETIQQGMKRRLLTDEEESVMEMKKERRERGRVPFSEGYNFA